MTRWQETEQKCNLLHERKLALPTKGDRGVKDVVADVFGRAKTFTIVILKGKNITNVEIIQNTAASYKHGAGPLTVKTLIDLGVTTVMASEFGPGVSMLLEQFNVTRIKVKSDTPVADAIKVFLE
jgi:predicted Fe-Mo cluster-binding NifX family protein